MENISGQDIALMDKPLSVASTIGGVNGKIYVHPYVCNHIENPYMITSLCLLLLAS